MNPLVLSAFAALVLASPGAHAHGDSAEGQRASASTHDGDFGTPFGRPGNPKAVGRTVTIRMSDAMRFTPDSVTVRRGETIRFVVRNEGKILHEMVLGNEEGLKAHAALMRRFPEMEHDEPYMVHVQPGKTGQMIWTFDKPGQIGFACLIPGHYEAGMTGKVTAK
jgi:uncharacterized cupredoxin-like copper-binding protein